MVVDSLISVLGGGGAPPFLCYPIRTVKKAHMSVNLEVKGSLAKCLATENLIIEHKKVPTACFDVDRRVLTLPMWDKASATVYDLLVGHEVGHALFTDNIDWTIDYPDVPKDFINVIEDVRVERLMKKKYPGLSKTFYNGYNELNSEDFFSTKDTNLDDLSFIDRINMYFKIGAFHNIAFSDEENEFLSRISKLETFKEVLDVAREIVEFVKYKRKELTEMPDFVQNQGESGEEVDLPQNSEQNQGESEDGDKTQIEQESESSSTSGEDFEDESDITMQQEAPNGGGGNEPSREHGEFDELESKTSQSFDQKSQDLTNSYAQETTYVELPKMYLENVIIPNSYIHKKASDYYNKEANSWVRGEYPAVIQEYQQYKSSAVKEVNYLVKEFECKKSADQYARATTARTGVLDTSKLHTYKYNEDLFRKVSVIPDGKNHGLIFILDWSGSMAHWMLDTCKQLFNLIWFCRKVNIPFEVYAFSVDCNAYVDIQPNHPNVIEMQDAVLAPEKSFRLLNIFTSKVNARETEEQMKHIWSCCWAFQKGNFGYPRHLELSGSPLGDTMIALHSLIPQFQRENKLQKVNVVFLTDGEGYVNAITKVKKSHSGDYIGYTKNYRTTLRDRKTGRIYPGFEYGNFPQYAKVLLTSLKDKFPTVNFVNFRVVPGKDFHNCYQWYGREDGDYEKVKAKYKKEQFITFTGTGFDQFNVLPTTSLSQDETFEVEEGATNAKIKSAFVKMLGKKKTNKKLLSSFVDLIA
jgi:hypothetical protein